MTARASRTDVVLVVPPFVSVLRPALGVSSLKAALRERGVSCRVEYANLDFAEILGVDLYEQVAEFASIVLLGEWVFSGAAFGGRRAPQQDLLEARIARHLDPGARARLEAARGRAEAFVRAIAERVLASSPAVVGFTTSFQQTCASLAIARAMRQMDRTSVLCLGGANCEGAMGQGLLDSFPWIDAVFSGEAERTFPDFCQGVLAGSRPARALVAPSALVSCLDELPIPDFSDYFERLARSSFRGRVQPGLVFEASRGCWWGEKHHCRFCGLNGSSMTYRTKSPERVREELETLSSRHGVPRFEAVDNILDHRTGLGMLEAIRASGARYDLFFEIKANLDEESTAALAACGVTWVQPGIESLDDDRLAAMDKGVGALQNVRLLRNCRTNGIRTYWSLLYSFPGDRPEHYDRMALLLPLLEHLEPPMGLHPVRLDRFSPWFERAAELGFGTVRPLDSYLGVYPLPEEEVARIAYFFSGDPDTASCGDAYERLQQAVSVWQARAGAAEPPRLAIERLGSRAVVHDTRACAVLRRIELDERELTVLEAFAAPGAIERRLATLPSVRPEEAHAALERLVRHALVLRSGGRAVHLVTEEPGRASVSARGGFPGGWLLEGTNEALFAR